MSISISDNSGCFIVRRSPAGTNRAPAENAAADDGHAGGHLPSRPVHTQDLADTSACISTTSWMQQSGVYRRQKSSRLIVVSGELVALSSLAQHRSLSLRHAIASPSRWSKTGHTALRSWHRYAARWLTGLVTVLTACVRTSAARVHELLLSGKMLLMMIY